MSGTQRYRDQHQKIMSIATELGRQLIPSQLAVDGSAAHRMLSELSGKLIVHLAAEDTLLYPQLLSCRDTATQQLARRFVSEMGPLAQAFKAYVVRWTLKQIESKPQEFADETRTIVHALRERIQRENTELYPLADKL